MLRNGPSTRLETTALAMSTSCQVCIGNRDISPLAILVYGKREQRS